MSIHDWTRVKSGTFHDFHQDWTVEICRTLNRGVLPPGYFAMAEKQVTGPEPDVVTLQLRTHDSPGGLAVAEAPPRVRQSARKQTERGIYGVPLNTIGQNRLTRRNPWPDMDSSAKSDEFGEK